jgi:hypothetical protein
MTTLEIDVGDLHPRSVSFSDTELSVTLAVGCKIVTPLDWYPRLLNASRSARENYEFMPMGIHWLDLDEDLGVVGMLRGRPAK